MIEIKPIKNNTQNISVSDGEDVVIFELVNKFSDINDKHIESQVSYGKNSRVKHIFLLDDSVEKSFVDRRMVEIGEGAEVKSFYCYLGGDQNSVHIHHKIGKNSRLDHRTIFFGHKGQYYDFDEKYNFLSTDAFGRFLNQGLVKDASQTNYVSNIMIDPGAQKTDSRLDMQAIILGDHARAVMVPSLQIEANDVKAGHGATVAQIGEDQLFYLRSRGLSKEQALELFIEGIFIDFVEKMGEEKIGEDMMKIVKGKMRM